MPDHLHHHHHHHHITNNDQQYEQQHRSTATTKAQVRRSGVERRGIYDIINLLKSLGVLARKAQDRYAWNGFQAIPRVLDVLKAAFICFWQSLDLLVCP